MATTIDGKLAPANRNFEPFGSRHDIQLFYDLRARADAILAGARTVDSIPTQFSPGPAKYRRLRLKRGLAEFNLRVIASGRGTLDPNAEIFRHRFSPIIILVSGQASDRNIRRLRRVADDVVVFGKENLDFVAAFAWLRRKWKVKRLLCEGGGELDFALLKSGLVDEIYQTVCPLVLGGREAPTMADGAGYDAIGKAIRVRLKSFRRIGHELFLVYKVKRKRRQ